MTTVFEQGERLVVALSTMGEGRLPVCVAIRSGDRRYDARNAQDSLLAARYSLLFRGTIGPRGEGAGGAAFANAELSPDRLMV